MLTQRLLNSEQEDKSCCPKPVRNSYWAGFSLMASGVTLAVAFLSILKLPEEPSAAEVALPAGALLATGVLDIASAGLYRSAKAALNIAESAVDTCCPKPLCQAFTSGASTVAAMASWGGLVWAATESGKKLVSQTNEELDNGLGTTLLATGGVGAAAAILAVQQFTEAKRSLRR